jgi:hypothetical protein
VEKCCRAGRPTDDNMAHGHCMLDTEGYIHTLRICNTYCISSATMVIRTCLNVVFYVHCLSRSSSGRDMVSDIAVYLVLLFVCTACPVVRKLLPNKHFIEL